MGVEVQHPKQRAHSRGDQDPAADAPPKRLRQVSPEQQLLARGLERNQQQGQQEKRQPGRYRDAPWPSGQRMDKSEFAAEDRELDAAADREAAPVDAEIGCDQGTPGPPVAALDA